MSIKKEQLEGRFVDLLKSIQPRPEFMRLFREVVLDVWNTRRREAGVVEVALVSPLAN